MRKILMGLATTAVMLAGVQLSAQSSKPVSIGIAGGAAIPVGDFSDAYNTGFNGTIALGLSLLRARGTTAGRPRPLVPRFLVFFVLASVLNTLGLIGTDARRALADAALALITTALAGVGLSADIGLMRRTGPRPLVLGAILWVCVATVSLLLQRATGQL